MKKKRTYRVISKRKRALFTVGIVLCAVVFAVCAFLLIRYGIQYRQAKEASRKLQEIYHAEAITSAPPAATPAPSQPPIPAPAATPFHAAAATLAPWQGNYPLNPYRAVRSPFITLKKKNPDIIGWLTAKDMLDEAVVQRDNEYYLRRDYQGKNNDNGALFLDESCDLASPARRSL